MAKRLLSFFLLVLLAGSVWAGIPFHTSQDSGMAAMPCCKAAKNLKAKKATAARLCCLVNCTDPVPPAPSGGQLNLAAPLVIAVQFIPARVSSSLTVASFWAGKRLTPRPAFQPKYIQNLALLI
jgi:hypothetical protein